MFELISRLFDTDETKQEENNGTLVSRVSCDENGDCKPKSHKDACICMIDIVNFSKWCNNKQPEEIFKTMTLYNMFLSDLITPFVDVEKIELVGDSVLIMAGLTQMTGVDTRVKNIVDLSVSILSHMEYIQSIFDKDISLRIGIHIGDVYSGFIENPTKFQLFGNSINTASRLERSSIPGTFTVSESAYRWFFRNPTPEFMEKFIFGNPIVCRFKGMGKVETRTGYIKQQKALIADDDQVALSSLERVAKMKYNLDSVYAHSVEDVFETMKRYVFEVCILDIYFANITVFSGLLEFRQWEKIHRQSKQTIILASAEIDEDYYIHQTYNNFMEGFVNKNKMFELTQYPEL